MKELIKKFIPSFLINWYHFLLAFFGALIYGFPSKKLKVIGVTGTKGKSTVVELATRILEEAGYKVASLSSIKFKTGEKEWKNELKMTMPGRFKLQRFLWQAKKANCQYAILEVTSEGILQHRHCFIDFTAAVFTNLSPEHIERHGSFERYRQAKGELFKKLKTQTKNKKISVINLDDENAGYFLQFPADERYGFYSANKKLEIENCKFIKAANVKISEKGIEFNINNIIFNLNLLGGFNVYNALAASCVGLSQGVPLETSKIALEKVMGIPGRMEFVATQPFKVVVDYAHTPDSLEKVYQTIKNPKSPAYAPPTPRLRPSGFGGQARLRRTNKASTDRQNPKLVCVLGACGGGRDKWKRPVMGKIAAKYCDEIILTNEDPYDEEPNQILEDIEKGVSSFKFQVSSFQKILDRRKAIRKALCLAGPGDTVVITGKGSEPWMCVARGRKIPWDDRQVVRGQLGKLKMENCGQKFEILPHTADLKIRVFGKTKEQLFENALFAMAKSLEPDTKSGGVEIKREFKINSIDFPSLLVDFLSEVLYLTQVHKELYKALEIKRFNNSLLEGKVIGQSVERFAKEIKAVTYHGLNIRKENALWQATIIFDI